MSFTFESLPPSDPYFLAWQKLRQWERRSAWGCLLFFVVLPLFVYVFGRLVYLVGFGLWRTDEVCVVRAEEMGAGKPNGAGVAGPACWISIPSATE